MFYIIPMCNICLNSGKKLIKLQDINIKLLDILTVLSPDFEHLKIHLPLYICRQCNIFLEKILDFQTLFIFNTTILKSYVQKLKSEVKSNCYNSVKIRLNTDIQTVKNDLVLTTGKAKYDSSDLEIHFDSSETTDSQVVNKTNEHALPTMNSINKFNTKNDTLESDSSYKPESAFSGDDSDSYVSDLLPEIENPRNNEIDQINSKNIIYNSRNKLDSMLSTSKRENNAKCQNENNFIDVKMENYVLTKGKVKSDSSDLEIHFDSSETTDSQVVNKTNEHALPTMNSINKFNTKNDTFESDSSYKPESAFSGDSDSYDSDLLPEIERLKNNEICEINSKNIINNIRNKLASKLSTSKRENNAACQNKNNFIDVKMGNYVLTKGKVKSDSSDLEINSDSSETTDSQVVNKTSEHALPTMNSINKFNTKNDTFESDSSYMSESDFSGEDSDSYDSDLLPEIERPRSNEICQINSKNIINNIRNKLASKLSTSKRENNAACQNENNFIDVKMENYNSHIIKPDPELNITDVFL